MQLASPNFPIFLQPVKPPAVSRKPPVTTDPSRGFGRRRLSANPAASAAPSLCARATSARAARHQLRDTQCRTKVVASAPLPSARSSENAWLTLEGEQKFSIVSG